jgi:CO/xanthine dehydrogenase FAD-binding subunit
VIPFAFDYDRPATLREAVALFQRRQAEGKRPRYYNGGTEILTLARLGLLQTGAVIDLKGIPECLALERSPGHLVIGAAVPLTAIVDSNLFPLLGETCRQIADRTARNKITLGGNICGEIIYKEAVLPLLLTDCDLVLTGPAGVRSASVHQAFQEHIRLRPGEFVVQAQIRPEMVLQPFVTVKKRRSGNIGYPVLTLAALRHGGRVRLALSGVCGFPFRATAMEGVLNDGAAPLAERVERAVKLLPGPVQDDPEAQADYRLHVLQRTLADALESLEVS